MFMIGSFLALAFANPSAASAPVDFRRAEQVHISLSSFRIAPGMLHLKAVRPVILTITNGFGGHDLSASEFFAAAAIRPSDVQFIDEGMIKVRGVER